VLAFLVFEVGVLSDDFCLVSYSTWIETVRITGIPGGVYGFAGSLDDVVALAWLG
jgi:hypothetical protein